MSKPARKSAPKPKADPEEYNRFLETAKAVEASEDPKEFERAFKKIVPQKGRSAS
jgi:hypothetical protein